MEYDLDQEPRLHNMWEVEIDQNELFDLVAAEDRNRERLAIMQEIRDSGLVLEKMEDPDSDVGVEELEQRSRKRKNMEDAADMETNIAGSYKIIVRTNGEISGCSTDDVDHGVDGGAVGPEPPLPP